MAKHNDIIQHGREVEHSRSTLLSSVKCERVGLYCGYAHPHLCFMIILMYEIMLLYWDCTPVDT